MEQFKHLDAKTIELAGIEAIPTQVILDETGKEYFRHTGFFPEEELIKVLKQKGAKLRFSIPPGK